MNDVLDRIPKIPIFRPSPGVPKILHQVFLLGWDAVPAQIRNDHVPSLRARNPDWEYRFFDSAAAKKFIEENYGTGMLQIYESIDPAYYAARGDLLRYLIIYATGGVYIDMKSDAVRPLDALIRPNDAFLLSQWPTDQSHRYGSAGRHPELSHIPGGEYQQWFIIASRGHPFLRAVIERVIANLTSYHPFKDGVGAHGVLNVTGPIAYTLAIHPVLERHPHRVIRSLEEDILTYSIFPEKVGHRDAGHYAYVTRPLVATNPAIDLTARVVFKVRRNIHRLGVRLGLS